MAQTEAAFQVQAIELAQLYGWLVAHFRPAETGRGWRTAVQGDGVGFPDLVLVRAPRLIVAELKTEKGRLSAAQQQWLDAFSWVPNVETCLWRPSMFDAIHEQLKRDDRPRTIAGAHKIAA